MRLTELANNIKQDSFWQVMVISFFALVLAYLSEIILDLRPCILCIYQRIPYLILLFVSLLSIKFKSIKKFSRFFIVFLFILEISLAFYHVGVERYMFEESHTCQDNHQLGSLLSTVQLASNCSQVSFKFMNFSMAEWNLFYSFGFLCLFVYKERENGFFTW